MDADADNVDDEHAPAEDRGGKKKKLTKRIRPHSNPYTPPVAPPPPSPDAVQWDKIFSTWEPGAVVEVADIGCGFGGLLRGLGPIMPDKYILGLEIRDAAVDYVRDQIAKNQSTEPGLARIGVCTVNCQKHLPNYFRKAQLTKMYFLYADPHFKKSKWERRIISKDLLDVYAYVLAVGGTLYTVTDVEALHTWEAEALDGHPFFRRATQAEMDADPTIPVMLTCTDEAKKAKRGTCT